MDIIEEIRELVEEHPKTYSSLIKSNLNFLHIGKFLDERFPMLSDVSYNMATKVYWALNGIRSFEDCLCPVCGGKRIGQNVKGIGEGYPYACSRKCAASNPKRKEKTRNTCLEKFGSETFLGSEAGNNMKDWWLKEHGVENVFQLESVKEKSRRTRLERYGHEYTMQSPEKRNLASENYKNKTGYDSQFRNPEVLDKITGTKLKKRLLGIDDKSIFRENARRKRYRTFIENDEISPNFTEEKFCRLTSKTQYTTLLSWHCKVCGKDFEATIDQNFSSRMHIPVRCLNCHPEMDSGYSNLENEVSDFVKNHCGCDIIENTRDVISPFEIDVFVKDRKLAFEFDGLHWHSESMGKGRMYHLSKTEMCEKNGIQLIHIFEDEWIERTEIVKSRIKNLLGIYDETVFARKCSVKHVDHEESMKFLDENHIQGRCSSSINIGLYHKDVLISLMTFGKSRFSGKYQYELLRFCNKVGFHVPGSASRLLKAFEREYSPESLVSYADRRWSMGNVYRKLGFSFSHNSSPDYFYVKGQKRYSRMRFQKHKLKSILEKFDESKTEVQNMSNNGYERIFDCGNMVFTKTY